jgi:hypothetical protein
MLIPFFASETTDYCTLGVAAFAVLVSLAALAFQLKSAEAMSYTTMLLDMDRLLIDKPELWQIYDRHAPAAGSPAAQEYSLAAFGYLHFNLFQFLYDAHRSILRRTLMIAFGSSQWKTEKAFIRHFLGESSRARTLLADPIMDDLYPRGFLTFLRGQVPPIRKS